ncbi:MAG: universal stress protein [Chloroflexota bacterium]
MIKKILVPLDKSELAAQALPLARSIAMATGAEIILLSVIEPGEYWSGDPNDIPWQRAQERTASRYLDEIAGGEFRKDIAVRVRLAWGPAASTIREIAGEENVDLIVMTTHGRSGLVRWVMGSVTNKLVHTSTHPMVLVYAREECGAKEPAKIERILVPLDGSARSEAVLPIVGELALELEATLLLERVIVPHSLLFAGEYSADRLPFLEEEAEPAQEYLDRIAAQQRSRGLTVETDVHTGHTAIAILDAANRREADMIALSTHGRTGPGRWVIGSVADAVVRHSTLPCLVLPTREAVPAGELRSAVAKASERL